MSAIKDHMHFDEEPRCDLYLGDCLEILQALKCTNLKIDAMITDPPYGINFKYNQHDDAPEDYQAFVWPRIALAESLLLPGSPVFVWQAQKWMPQFHELFPRPWRIFIAAKNFVQMLPGVMQCAYDPVVVWWTEGDKEEWGRGINLVTRDWFISDSARQVLKINALEKQHPCPRQLDVVSHVVAIWTRPNGVVIDPFIGSGTTAVACVNLKRRCIGIESDPDYFSIAVERTKQARESYFSRLPGFNDEIAIHESLDFFPEENGDRKIELAIEHIPSEPPKRGSLF